MADAWPALLLLISCASPGPPAPVSVTPERSDPYLAAPTEGYPLISAADLSARVEAAYRDLVAGRAAPEIEAAGRELLERDPGFHPAQVLLAQVDYVRGDDSAALQRLAPVIDEHPGYVAAQLLLGGSAERSGDLPAAFVAFSSIADAGSEPGELAARRAFELRPRAIEIVLNRLTDELGRGRLEGAEPHLAWLEKWAGDSLEALEAGRLIAVERGDLERELEIVRRMVTETGDRTWRRREAELEVEIGDVRRGLEKLEDLVRQDPDDPRLAETLELAKFLWRIQLLPQEVRDVGREGELDRADLATLLYWLLPSVRHSELSNPPIATDILDHPGRDVILRVLNLGLMEVDVTLHRFEPAEAATRVMVFHALLTLLQRSERELSCLDDPNALALDRSWSSVCRQAARCGLIEEAAACRPAASISGPAVLELIRHTLDLLGG